MSEFELFDRKQEFTVRHGALPHSYQPGVNYFVTFRTEDSVPQPLLRAWHRRRDDWLRQQGISHREPDWRIRLSASSDVERQYHTKFTRPYMSYLDRAYGACHLSVRQVAEQVLNALLHFGGNRYHMGDFVIMPNHVHLLVSLLGSTSA